MRRSTRRSFLGGAPAFLTLTSSHQGFTAEQPLAAIEARHGGRLGVFVMDTGSGRTLSHRPDERFTMCSTFKGLLAAQVLSRIERGHESLTRLIHYSAHDLSNAGYPDFACPVTAANVARGALTVDTLCQAVVEVSDNLAAILLMRSVGGPTALTRFIRGLGDNVTRSDRYEPASNSYDGVLDTTTPRAMTKSVNAILRGAMLGPASRGLLESWMIDSTPGLKRLRASFPSNWIVGDKAGTSEDETNDYAIARPPGHKPFIAAAYYNTSKADFDQREAVLREVGAVIVTWLGN